MHVLFGLFISFFKIGLFSFGGGYAMLPLIYQEVNRVGSMSPSQFNELVALSQVTPGPIAINAATYSGFEVAGVAGTVVSTFGAVLPEFILMLLMVRFLAKTGDNPLVKGAFEGIRPATVGLMGAAWIYIARGNLVSEEGLSHLASDPAGYFNLVPIAFFAAAVLMNGPFRISSMKTILILGACGALLYGFTDIPL